MTGRRLPLRCLHLSLDPTTKPLRHVRRGPSCRLMKGQAERVAPEAGVVMRTATIRSMTQGGTSGFRTRWTCQAIPRRRGLHAPTLCSES